MIPSLLSLTRRYGSLVKFAAVGGAVSVVHGSISWMLYYHVLCGRTVLSTLAGYGGGWLASYLGNRLWSFRDQAKKPRSPARLCASRSANWRPCGAYCSPPHGPSSASSSSTSAGISSPTI